MAKNKSCSQAFLVCFEFDLQRKRDKERERKKEKKAIES
jgi:hypothetical protein